MSEPRTVTARAILLLLGIGAFAASCGTQALSPRSVARELHHRQQVKFHQRLFIVSLSRGPTLEEARQRAYAMISQQLTWLPKGGRLLLEGLYRVDRHQRDDRGQVHVLALLEREAAAAHLRKVASERQGELKQALDRCERLLSDGEIAVARDHHEKSVAPRVEVIRNLLAAARAAVGDQARPALFEGEQRARELAAKIADKSSRTRAALVTVLGEADGRALGQVSALSQEVSRRGMKLARGALPASAVTAALSGETGAAATAGRAAGAGYVIAGEVRARFSSEESGQFFAWAAGRVRVIETTAGRVVAEVSCERVKGGHISRSQAVDRALANAVSRLRRALGQRLRALSR